MDFTTAGRALITESLAFHILIVALSIGLPVIMSIFEFIAWRRRDERAKSFVRLLAVWTAIFAIGGVMSGTIIALQFSTLWAPYLDAARPYVGQFFQLEGYMFLVEAAFLSWYLFTMKEVGTRNHFLLGLPISIGTIGSAVFITSVNAWMNNPSAIITSTTFNEIGHSVLSYLFSTALVLIGYVSWRSMKRTDNTTKKFLETTLFRLAIICGIFFVLLGLMGHRSAVDIGETQPHKLAAIEILDKTTTNAPLRLGGSYDEATGTSSGGIVLPGMLSVLAGNSFDHEVKGLDQVPKDKRPMLIVHEFFDIKMILVGVSAALIAGVIFFYWRKRSQPRWFKLTLVALGSLGFVMVELGWMITEFGRQPYTIQGKLLTRDAMTKGIDVISSAYIFPILFVLLTIATIIALRFATREWRKKEKYSW